MSPLLIGTLLAVSADPVTYELDGNSLKVPYAVTFDTGKPSLKPQSEAALDFVKRYLDEKSSISTLRVEVHSDATGSSAANQKLSEARAAAIVSALIKRGVDCKRLVAVGFGETKPMAPNDTPEGKARNRRVEFVNAALRGKPIGGLRLDGGGVVAPVPCD
jgi:OOP family OmpA-OmpF porin